jgi:hypothetical protein
MPKRHDNIIYKLFLRSKKIIKAIPSSITKIGPIVYIEDPKETLSVNHIYIKKDTKVEETTIVNIITINYLIRSDTISIINLDISQVSI